MPDALLREARLGVLEAVVALRDQPCCNTGISTYVRVLNNCRGPGARPERRRNAFPKLITPFAEATPHIDRTDLPAVRREVM
jgi:hypothetical protein